MPRLCSVDECNKRHKAKGLCGTHYNQQDPNRHKKITVTCESCGNPALKESRARRYKGTYCSEYCRDYAKWGPRSSRLPPTHWVFWIGKTCEWAPPESFNCGWCEQPSMVMGNRDTYCSDACRLRSKRARRRGREHGAHGTYTWAQVVKLWASFNRCCAYCRVPTQLNDIQPEHVVALSRGGANNIGNMLPSCMPCNADKRDLSLAEWERDRARRNLPPVVTQWHTSDPLYSHLTEANYHLAA